MGQQAAQLTPTVGQWSTPTDDWPLLGDVPALSTPQANYNGVPTFGTHLGLATVQLPDGTVRTDHYPAKPTSQDPMSQAANHLNTAVNLGRKAIVEGKTT